VVGGRVRAIGPLGSLLSARLLSTEVLLLPNPGGLPPLPAGARQRDSTEGTVVELPEGADVDRFLVDVLAAGANVLAVSPRKESLEDLFLREARGGGGAAA
jgi:ABC-2 type transport system ATP-binding protein